MTDPAGTSASSESVALSPSAVRLAELLEQVSYRAVGLPELWSLWATADAASAARHDRRTALAQALTQLAAAGLLTPSKKQDTTARPHLPVRLTLPPPAPSETAAALARTIVWRPELAWVLNARLTLGQIGQLRRINMWLRDRGRGIDVLPLRERSLEVLGHEKAFDSLLNTSVFGEDRLTLEHLRTFRVHPPLPVVRIGEGPVLLVVENDDTFHSIRTVLLEEPGPAGHLAWGAGGAFEASVRSCGDLPGVERVRYFGDIDAAGMRIPRNAAAIADREDLPPITAAVALYEALLEQPVRQAGQALVPEEQAAALTSWLGGMAIADEVMTLLTSGVRVPQEALTYTMLNGDRRWRADL